jgi:diaminohydroxyphosphoribosylaminopyrimidine deaminase/5-amino-6-(5-phosphoribosylamino)uracil reductase
LVEGGKQLLDSFIEQNLWDEAFVFVGSDKFEKGVKAPVIGLVPDKIFTLGTNGVKHYTKEA